MYTTLYVYICMHIYVILLEYATCKYILCMCIYIHTYVRLIVHVRDVLPCFSGPSQTAIITHEAQTPQKHRMRTRRPLTTMILADPKQTLVLAMHNETRTACTDHDSWPGPYRGVTWEPRPRIGSDHN